MITTHLGKRTTKSNDALLRNRFTLLHFNYAFLESVNSVISAFRAVFNTFTLIFNKLSIRKVTKHIFIYARASKKISVKRKKRSYFLEPQGIKAFTFSVKTWKVR